VGSRLTRVATTLFWVEVEAVMVVAAAPVTARTRTKARTISFMVVTPNWVVTSKISLDRPAKKTIEWNRY
jgi:hypothetical protein